MTESTENSNTQTSSATDHASKPARTYSFQVEAPDAADRAGKFLTAFQTILKHSNYAGVLDQYARMDMKCGRCAEMCQIYLTTRDPRDNPCLRTNLLLKVYKKYFMNDAGRDSVLKKGPLTDTQVDELVESFYRCTTCKRCVQECPAGIDHALITHLGR